MTNVIGSMASRCTTYRVVETKNGCDPQSIAANSGAQCELPIEGLRRLIPSCNRASTIANKATLSTCSARFVRLNGHGSAGHACASRRNVSSATGRPVGSALPEVR